MLKFKADIKTLIYFAIITTMFVLQWYYGFNWHSPISWAAYIIYLHFAVSVAVITHNHNHINIWTNKTLNILTDWWLTVFYGLPIFVWIPTHNRNHHRYNNKADDVTRTYRHTENNDLTAILMYPTISGKNQMKEGIIPYMKDLKSKNAEQYKENLMQIGVLLLWVVGFLILSWKKAILFILIPQQVAQITVIVFNYVQHVHADEESEWNHSRNFMWVNAFLFNNGYHTVHHQRASMHWSETPEAHARVAHKIAPHLIENSFWGYLIRTYILSIFIDKYKSNSMRQERQAKARLEAEQAAA